MIIKLRSRSIRALPFDNYVTFIYSFPNDPWRWSSPATASLPKLMTPTFTRGQEFFYFRGEICPIYVLAVVQPPEPADLVEMDAIIDAGTEHYEELFKELRQKGAAAGVAVTDEVAVGHPADQIVHYAAEKGCDMILIGQRGKSRMEQWLLGSVSKRVAAYAHCTVTIVK